MFEYLTKNGLWIIGKIQGKNERKSEKEKPRTQFMKEAMKDGTVKTYRDL